MNSEPVEDEQANLDMELMNEARYLAQADIPETVRRSILAEREKKAATGVKVSFDCLVAIESYLMARVYLRITKRLQLWRTNRELPMPISAQLS